jgi:hypothetical protein
MDDPTMLQSQPLIASGGNFSNMRAHRSRTLRTTRSLMLKVVKIKKVKPSGLGKHTKDSIRNGLFSILKIRRKTRLLSMEDSRLTNHSTSSQECQ